MDSVGITWWKHGGGSTGDGVLPLFGKIRDPPDEDAIERSGRHFPQPTLHLSDCQILQPHRPLQLTHLRHKHTLCLRYWVGLLGNIITLHMTLFFFKMIWSFYLASCPQIVKTSAGTLVIPCYSEPRSCPGPVCADGCWPPWWWRTSPPLCSGHTPHFQTCRL